MVQKKNKRDEELDKMTTTELLDHVSKRIQQSESQVTSNPSEPTTEQGQPEEKTPLDATECVATENSSAINKTEGEAKNESVQERAETYKELDIQDASQRERQDGGDVSNESKKQSTSRLSGAKTPPALRRKRQTTTNAAAFAKVWAAAASKHKGQQHEQSKHPPTLPPVEAPENADVATKLKLRLQRLMQKLQMQPQQKLDLVLHHTSTSSQVPFEDALDAWEQGAAAIDLHAHAIAIEKSQEPPDRRVPPPKVVEQHVRDAAERLKRTTGQELTYAGKPYIAHFIDGQQ